MRLVIVRKEVMLVICFGPPGADPSREKLGEGGVHTQCLSLHSLPWARRYVRSRTALFVSHSLGRYSVPARVLMC